MANPAVLKEHTEQYLSFIIGEEEYGINILRVMEIRCWERPTPLPAVPAYIRGVINLRGVIVPITDLRARLDFPISTNMVNSVIIVIQIPTATGHRTMGIIVDAVSEVYDIDAAKIKSTPEISGREGNQTPLLKGLATIGDKMIILLEIEQIFNTEDIIHLDEAVKQFKA